MDRSGFFLPKTIGHGHKTRRVLTRRVLTRRVLTRRILTRRVLTRPSKKSALTLVLSKYLFQNSFNKIYYLSIFESNIR